MNVFINDIPLIIKKNSEKIYKHKYDLILNPEDEFTSKDLVGDVLVRDVTDVFIDRLLWDPLESTCRHASLSIL